MNGRKLKEAGQQLALLNSGDTWTETTIERLKAFCKVRKQLNKPLFRFEEFRLLAEKAGWDMPASPNAWGALPKIAVKRMIIASTGEYQAAQSARTHHHPVRVWQAI